jgi:hypothetical protein
MSRSPVSTRPTRQAAVFLPLFCGCVAGKGDPAEGQTLIDDTGGPCEKRVWYVDADGDGFGDPAASVELCGVPDGHSQLATDCDDGDIRVNPTVDEACDGVDNDCDGDIDEGLLAAAFRDADGDGYGDPDQLIEDCNEDGVLDGGDCDDAAANVNPEAVEQCDGLDNDCDGEIDEDLGSVWYTDADGDGYGADDESVESCDPPSGMGVDLTLTDGLGLLVA